MSVIRRFKLILLRSVFICVMFFILGGESNNKVNIGDTFTQCLISQPSTSTLGLCLGVGALNKLQSLDSDPQFDLIDGITYTKDAKEYREVYNFGEQDPSDFRTIVDSFSHVFSRRSMHWDMGFLYPGLGMRIAPSTSPGGVLEFVLDPQRELLNKHALKEIGTGRLMARQFLLPLLLGFKFNVVTLLPILFGFLALLAKKAVVISKIALVISSAYGLGTLLLGSGATTQNQYQHHNIYSPTLRPGFGGHYNRFPEEEYNPEIVYRNIGNTQEENNENNDTTDQFKLYGNLEEAYAREDKSKGRNFAWSEDEKGKKQQIV